MFRILILLLILAIVAIGAWRANTRSSAASVWRHLSLIGGERGYFYLDILWQLRGRSTG